METEGHVIRNPPIGALTPGLPHPQTSSVQGKSWCHRGGRSTWILDTLEPLANVQGQPESPESLTCGVKLTLAPLLRSNWATLRFS